MMATKINYTQKLKAKRQRERWRRFMHQCDVWLPRIIGLIIAGFIITHLIIFQNWLKGV